MKILWKDKDGGPESNVLCWGIEIKSLFSIMLLRFNFHTREQFHNHAFNAISWLLKGGLYERLLGMGPEAKVYRPSFVPIITYKHTLHRVQSNTGVSWAITFRGPWDKTWNEYDPNTDELYALTHGRKRVGE